MSLRNFVICLCLSVSAWASAPLTHAQNSARARRPNIVFILADDLGYGDLACYGHPTHRTPNIDRLARQGVRFTNFYANGPECTPTRAALLTGRYQQRVGGLECAIGTGNVGRYDDAIRLRQTHDLGLPVAETSVARLLKDRGYRTALFGKWHLGYEDKFAPNRHGFDQALYCIGGGMDYFHHVEDPPSYEPALRLNGQPARRNGYFTDVIADEAVSFIAANAARPFFLYVPFTAPHAPFQGPDERLPSPLPAGSPRWNQGKAPPEIYAAMIERMDAATGRILAALEAQGLSRNTLVIFTSDNGGTRSAFPTGLRDIKGTTFEGGIRVPCIVRWPGVLPAGPAAGPAAGKESAQVGITMDLTASLARIGGAAPAKDRPFDGIDLLARLEKKLPVIERTLCWRGRRGERTWRAVRDGAWKYVSRSDGDRREEFLFDLNRDQGEQTNLLSDRPAEAARLRTALAEWEAEVKPQR